MTGQPIGNAPADENHEAQFQIDPDMLGRIDVWRGRQTSPPSRADAIRELLNAGIQASAPAITAGETLILTMLCDLNRKIGAETEIDADFLRHAIKGGHFWAIEWQHPSLAHGHSNSVSQADLVSRILSLWKLLEESFRVLPVAEKGKVVRDAGLPSRPVFPGWNSARETNYRSIARFMTERMNLFSSLKGQVSRNASTPMVERYKQTLALYDAITRPGKDRQLTAHELVTLLSAGEYSEAAGSSS